VSRALHHAEVGGPGSDGIANSASQQGTIRIPPAIREQPRKQVLPARGLSLALVVNAQEDATVEAALYRGNRRVLRKRSTVKAYRSRIVRISNRFRPGRYSVRVTVRAALNTSRTKRFSTSLRIKR